MTDGMIFSKEFFFEIGNAFYKIAWGSIVKLIFKELKSEFGTKWLIEYNLTQGIKNNIKLL